MEFPSTELEQRRRFAWDRQEVILDGVNLIWMFHQSGKGVRGWILEPAVQGEVWAGDVNSGVVSMETAFKAECQWGPWDGESSREEQWPQHWTLWNLGQWKESSSGDWGERCQFLRRARESGILEANKHLRERVCHYQGLLSGAGWALMTCYWKGLQGRPGQGCFTGVGAVPMHVCSSLHPFRRCPLSPWSNKRQNTRGNFSDIFLSDWGIHIRGWNPALNGWWFLKVVTFVFKGLGQMGRGQHSRPEKHRMPGLGTWKKAALLWHWRRCWRAGDEPTFSRQAGLHGEGYVVRPVTAGNHWGFVPHDGSVRPVPRRAGCRTPRRGESES